MPKLQKVCELLIQDKLRGFRLMDALDYLSDPKVAADLVYETVENDLYKEAPALSDKLSFLVQILLRATRISPLTN